MAAYSKTYILGLTTNATQHTRMEIEHIVTCMIELDIDTISALIASMSSSCSLVSD